MGTFIEKQTAELTAAQKSTHTLSKIVPLNNNIFFAEKSPPKSHRKPKHLVTTKSYLSDTFGQKISEFFDLCRHWMSMSLTNP